MKYKKARLVKDSVIDSINIRDTFDLNAEDIDMPIRAGGEFKNRAFYLKGDYVWIIREDSEGVLCLIPIEKGE